MGEKERSASWMPLYIVGGLLVVGVLVTTIVGESTGPRGSVLTGDRCEQTRDCAEPRDVCYQSGRHYLCTRTCNPRSPSCPDGTECQSIGEHKRRRNLRIRNVCLP